MRIVFGVGIGFAADGSPLSDVEAKIKRAVFATSQRFGGCFVTRGEGGWLNPMGDIVTEPGITITVDVDGIDESDARIHGQYLRKLFSQHTVIVSLLPEVASTLV